MSMIRAARSFDFPEDSQRIMYSVLYEVAIYLISDFLLFVILPGQIGAELQQVSVFASIIVFQQL